jgi:hypothetical protein
MSTLQDLCASGALFRLDPGLDEDEMPLRSVYIFLHVKEQIDKLKGVASQIGHEVDQDDQLDDLLLVLHWQEFSCPNQFHVMDYKDPGVWELKTPDLRVFGWFLRRTTSFARM